MLTTLKFALLLGTFAAAIIMAAEPAGAQGGSSDASAAPLPLNEATFTKYVKASSNYVSYIKQHPEDVNHSDASYDNVADGAKAVCEPHPGVQKAIAAAGLTCVQWVMLSSQLLKAGSAARITKKGQKVPPEFGVSPADIDFYNKHATEIGATIDKLSAADGTE